MAYKGKVVTGTPVTYTKFANVQGSNKRTPGGDTVPGPMKGAPLMNSRTVDDSTAVEKRYHAGNPATIGGMNSVEVPYQANRVGKEPVNDSPTRDSNQFPDLHTSSKAQEVRANDPSTGLGVGLPRKGTLGADHGYGAEPESNKQLDPATKLPDSQHGRFRGFRGY